MKSWEAREGSWKTMELMLEEFREVLWGKFRQDNCCSVTFPGSYSQYVLEATLEPICPASDASFLSTMPLSYLYACVYVCLHMFMYTFVYVYL